MSKAINDTFKARIIKKTNNLFDCHCGGRPQSVGHDVDIYDRSAYTMECDKCGFRTAFTCSVNEAAIQWNMRQAYMWFCKEHPEEAEELRKLEVGGD